ncbi:MAG: flavin reductase family protein [Actinobacteria bacterium]|nr:flavin reductase family protein [Actinomycetota bacterium]MBW3649996.1 flavin reductase family protein [Actinomycetota bacterium]
MLIVTTSDGRDRSGCLVGFATQCSIDPPLLMVWLSERNHTTRVAAGATHLLVHFPSSDQRDLATLFGSQTGDEVDKFGLCSWEHGPEGLPLLSECSNWVAGRIVERLETGDHVGHLLEPIAAACGPWAAQLGFQSIKDLDPGHEA